MIQKSTSLLCGIALALPVVSASAQLFTDGFNTAGSSSNWNVQTSSADTSITFGWDYFANMGIPSAPNGSGTTGVRMAANIATSPAVAAGISMTPILGAGVNLPTNYVVKFDMWINVFGPFPGGGAGSTEWAVFGVGTSGNQVQRVVGTGAGAGADGRWFAVDGEGGNSIDFRAYSGGTLQGPTTGVYAAGTHADIGTAPGNVNNVRRWSNPYYHTALPGGNEAPASQLAAYGSQTGQTNPGTVGMSWVEVEIKVTGALVEWYINNLLIASFTDHDGLGNIFIGYNDFNGGVSGGPDLSFAVFDNFTVIPEPSTYALFAGLGFLGLAIWRRSRKSAA